MPSGWLYAFAAMYPRLRDEELLREITAVSAGSGTMREQDRLNLMDGLQQSAPRRKRERPTAAVLAAAGIRVVNS